MPALIRLTFESNFGSGDTISVKLKVVQIPTLSVRVAATTVTETRKHLMSENWDHYGGMEVRDGETVQWNANWERGAATFDVSGSTGIDQSSTSHSVFGDGGTSEVYARTESWEGYYGTETETTYYDAAGTKLGSSWSGSSSWDDGNGNTITNTSTNYSGPDWEWLGARGLTRMRMVMFFQAALILRPLLKSIKLGRPTTYYCLDSTYNGV